MFRKRENKEIEAFCGYCGERLPALDDGAFSACPNCSRRRNPERRPLKKLIAVDAIEQGKVYGARAWEFVQGPRPFYRDPLLAALLSTCLPGAGQIYNHQFLKGILIFATSWLVIPYFIGIFDAFVSARSLNKYEIAAAASANAGGESQGV